MSNFPPTPPDHTELPLLLYPKAPSPLLWIYDAETMLISLGHRTHLQICNRTRAVNHQLLEVIVGGKEANNEILE